MVTFNGTSLAKMVKGNTVAFSFYKENKLKEGELWYEIKVLDKIFHFPVPISEVGEATFLSTDKATIFMRYIRKELEAIEKQRLIVETEKLKAIESGELSVSDANLGVTS